ncbi:MAG: organomercurial lyase [Thermocrispum sp.]
MPSTTTPTTAAAVADLTKPGGALDLGADAGRLITRMLRLLAQGEPLTSDRVDAAVAELGIDTGVAEQTLRAWTERDADGVIRGLGITYNPTAHQMTIDGADMWAWCAMDTLIFTIVLGKPTAIASTSPGSDETVRLHADPDGILDATPADAVITWPRRDSAAADMSSTTAIWGSFCHHSFFFGNRANAEEWAAGRDDIDILSLDDGFAVARELAGALMRYDTDRIRETP